MFIVWFICLFFLSIGSNCFDFIEECQVTYWVNARFRTWKKPGDRIRVDFYVYDVPLEPLRIQFNGTEKIVAFTTLNQLQETKVGWILPKIGWNTFYLVYRSSIGLIAENDRGIELQRSTPEQLMLNFSFPQELNFFGPYFTIGCHSDFKFLILHPFGGKVNPIMDFRDNVTSLDIYSSINPEFTMKFEYVYGTGGSFYICQTHPDSNVVELRAERCFLTNKVEYRLEIPLEDYKHKENLVYNPTRVKSAFKHEITMISDTRNYGSILIRMRSSGSNSVSMTTNFKTTATTSQPPNSTTAIPPPLTSSELFIIILVLGVGVLLVAFTGILTYFLIKKFTKPPEDNIALRNLNVENRQNPAEMYIGDGPYLNEFIVPPPLDSIYDGLEYDTLESNEMACAIKCDNSTDTYIGDGPYFNESIYDGLEYDTIENKENEK